MEDAKKFEIFARAIFFSILFRRTMVQKIKKKVQPQKIVKSNL